MYNRYLTYVSCIIKLYHNALHFSITYSLLRTLLQDLDVNPEVALKCVKQLKKKRNT